MGLSSGMSNSPRPGTGLFPSLVAGFEKRSGRFCRTNFWPILSIPYPTPKFSRDLHFLESPLFFVSLRIFAPTHLFNDLLEGVGRPIRANFPSGFLKPLGLALILYLRLFLLLFACFSHAGAQRLGVR